MDEISDAIGEGMNVVLKKKQGMIFLEQDWRDICNTLKKIK